MDHTPEPWKCEKMDGAIDRDRLMLALREIARIAGGDMTPAASVDFHMGVVGEVRLWKAGIEADRDRWKALAVEAVHQLKMLAGSSNGVTAYHRHGNKIPLKKIDSLYERQLKAEEYVFRFQEAMNEGN